MLTRYALFTHHWKIIYIFICFVRRHIKANITEHQPICTCDTNMHWMLSLHGSSAVQVCDLFVCDFLYSVLFITFTYIGVIIDSIFIFVNDIVSQF